MLRQKPPLVADEAAELALVGGAALGVATCQIVGFAWIGSQVEQLLIARGEVVVILVWPLAEAEHYMIAGGEEIGAGVLLFGVGRPQQRTTLPVGRRVNADRIQQRPAGRLARS